MVSDRTALAEAKSHGCHQDPRRGQKVPIDGATGPAFWIQNRYSLGNLRGFSVSNARQQARSVIVSSSGKRVRYLRSTSSSNTRKAKMGELCSTNQKLARRFGESKLRPSLDFTALCKIEKLKGETTPGF